LRWIANAEEGGRTPEVMEKQAEFYQEESSLRLKVLTKVAGFGGRAVVAILITAIVRIFFTGYAPPIDELRNM
jgi:type II secretory pathway component PulF